MYPKALLDAFMSRQEEAPRAVPVAYCRVSSAAQEADLKSQHRVASGHRSQGSPAAL
jgi:hypothetical protein